MEKKNDIVATIDEKEVVLKNSSRRVLWTPPEKIPFIATVFLNDLPPLKYKFKPSRKKRLARFHYKKQQTILCNLIADYESRKELSYSSESYRKLELQSIYYHYKTLGLAKKELPHIINLLGRKKLPYRSWKKIIAHLKTFENENSTNCKS